jgi:hypothetical protein
MRGSTDSQLLDLATKRLRLAQERLTHAQEGLGFAQEELKLRQAMVNHSRELVTVCTMQIDEWISEVQSIQDDINRLTADKP